jgi:hypothetical protein
MVWPKKAKEDASFFDVKDITIDLQQQQLFIIPPLPSTSST